MARALRIEYDGAVYHVTSRGNGGQTVFNNKVVRELFLETLAQVNKKFNWICHAYCLMGNHYHLLVETPDGNLSAGMRQLNGVFTQHWNRKQKQSGHLFQGRYKSILVEKESHLLEVCRYVVLNPVRAGMVKTPEKWRWSSYRATAGLDSIPVCLTTDWVLGQFSSRRATARKRYGEFVRTGLKEPGVWEGLVGGLVLGTEGFASTLADKARGRADMGEIPRRQRYVGRKSLNDLFSGAACKSLKRRNGRIRKAVLEHGYSQKEVADYLGLHYSVISRVVKEGEAPNARNKT